MFYLMFQNMHGTSSSQLDNGIIDYKGYGKKIVLPWKQTAWYPVFKKMYRGTRGKLFLQVLL